MYFKACNSFDELRKEYLKLSKKYHPDLNPQEKEAEFRAIFQTINNEYESLAKKMKSSKATEERFGEEKSKSYDFEVNEMLMKIIDELTKYDCTIEIVGLYVWVSNTKYEDKEAYKNLNMKWHGKHKKWYYTPLERTGHYSNWSFEKICDTYGYSEYKKQSNRLNG